MGQVGHRRRQVTYASAEESTQHCDWHTGGAQKSHVEPEWAWICSWYSTLPTRSSSRGPHNTQWIHNEPGERALSPSPHDCPSKARSSHSGARPQGSLLTYTRADQDIYLAPSATWTKASELRLSHSLWHNNLTFLSLWECHVDMFYLVKSTDVGELPFLALPPISSVTLENSLSLYVFRFSPLKLFLTCSEDKKQYAWTVPSPDPDPQR